jgi:hypothetical protein
VLEQLARRAGLAPRRRGEVDVPYELPDRATLERALLAPGGAAPAIEHSGEEVRNALAASAAPTAPTGSRTGSGI